MIMRLIRITKPNLQNDENDQRLRYLLSHLVIIAGGRDFEDYECMCEKLNDLFYNSTNFKMGDGKITYHYFPSFVRFFQR